MDFDWNQPPDTLSAERTAAGWRIRLSRQLSRWDVAIAALSMAPTFAAATALLEWLDPSMLTPGVAELVLALTVFGTSAGYLFAREYQGRLVLELDPTGVRWNGQHIDASQLGEVELRAVEGTARTRVLQELHVGPHRAEVVGHPDTLDWVVRAVRQVRQDAADSEALEPEVVEAMEGLRRRRKLGSGNPG